MYALIMVAHIVFLVFKKNMNLPKGQKLDGKLTLVILAKLYVKLDHINTWSTYVFCLRVKVPLFNGCYVKIISTEF